MAEKSWKGVEKAEIMENKRKQWKRTQKNKKEQKTTKFNRKERKIHRKNRK